MNVTPAPRPRPHFVVKTDREILPSGDLCYWIRLLIGAQRVGVFGRKSFMAPARLPGVAVDGGEILLTTFDDPKALASALEEAAAGLRKLA
jgi:hypothetical protein